MSNISLRLPESLHERLRELARREGVSINGLISSAVAEKVSALMTEEYLRERARRGSRERYERVLSSVRDVEPDPEDRLDRAGGRGSTMIWTAWSNGSGRPSGYGFRVPLPARDRWFSIEVGDVEVHLSGRDEPVVVHLSPSFWRECPEIRRVEIGEWLVAEGHAPWPKGQPPRFVVDVLGGGRFRVRRGEEPR